MRCMAFVLITVFSLFGCTNNDGKTSGEDLPNIPSQKAVDGYTYNLNSGTLDLAKKSGCLACHGVEKEIVGPAWKAVSLRYKDYSGARSYLVDKVKNGGKDAWGNAPMPPYSPRVSDGVIQSLVERILKGEEGRVDLVDGDPVSGQLLAGEVDRFQFQADPNTKYELSLVSTVGDADLFVYNPLLPRDKALVASSELRGGNDVLAINAQEQPQYYEINVFGYLDTEYTLTLTGQMVLLGSPIPTAEQLAAYSYSLSADTLLLAKNSGCTACHDTESNVVGPAFKAISLRFKDDVPDAETRLIEKVHKGGKGYWGLVPMPPYSPRVSDQDIEALVKSILFGD